MAGALTVTVRDDRGAALAEVTVAAGRVAVAPPGAAVHPRVAAVVAQLERTATRPRPRPSCGAGR